MSKEQMFSKEEILLSTTDLDSRIKYANDNFCNIAGYTLDEMVGNYHNMVRHPSMPKAAFGDLWRFIQSGKSWMGPVKNRCKNGDYYWVNAFVTPIKDESGKVHEYQSVRTCPDRELVDRAEDLYAKLNKNETPFLLKYQTDVTLWVQLILFCLLFASIGLAFIAENFWMSVPFLLLSFCGAAVFTYWRGYYQGVVKEAKETFDNPMMSYLYSKNNDDIGAINLALQMKKAEIKAIVGRVSDDSDSIVSTAGQSAQRGSDVANTLNEQKVQTEQVATAINQMAATIQEIAQIVTQASQASQQGLDISNDGREIVLKTVSAINELSAQLSEVDAAIGRLTNGSQAIESVLGEISGIADQTNLLALNAAIEAARAGEQGRGFAVVAEEVRALAMRSQQSTEEISSLLSQLRSESEQAISAMNRSNELSQSCVNLAEQTDESLTKINQEVNEIANISSQIATAVEEQSVVAAQVDQNIITINEMSTDSEVHGKEAVTLGEALLKRLHEQKSLISQF